MSESLWTNEHKCISIPKTIKNCVEWIAVSICLGYVRTFLQNKHFIEVFAFDFQLN